MKNDLYNNETNDCSHYKSKILKKMLEFVITLTISIVSDVDQSNIPRDSTLDAFNNKIFLMRNF